MGWLDYPPGPIGWLGMMTDGGGGGDDGAGDAFWECSECGYSPVYAGDSSCGGCGESMDWSGVDT